MLLAGPSAAGGPSCLGNPQRSSRRRGDGGDDLRGGEGSDFCSGEGGNDDESGCEAFGP